MASGPFLAALDQLVADTDARDIAVMCSEAVWWRCHRRLIADAVVLRCGKEVFHLFHDGRLQAHAPTPEARVEASGFLVYESG